MKKNLQKIGTEFEVNLLMKCQKHSCNLKKMQQFKVYISDKTIIVLLRQQKHI